MNIDQPGPNNVGSSIDDFNNILDSESDLDSCTSLAMMLIHLSCLQLQLVCAPFRLRKKWTFGYTNWCYTYRLLFLLTMFYWKM